MVKSFRPTVISATILLVAALVMASATYSTAAKMAAKKKPAASNAKLIAQGKALVTQYRCNGCHGANLHGLSGRTPNITPSGGLKEYNLTKFEAVLNTGVTADGGQLKGMPVLHMPASKSSAIYAYLKTLK